MSYPTQYPSGDPKKKSVPELDSPDRGVHFRGIPTTEEEQKAKKAKNSWFKVWNQSEAFD